LVRNPQECAERERKAVRLIEEITAQGLTITAESGRLRVKPSGQLAPRQRDAMIALRDEVLSLLTTSEPLPKPSHTVSEPPMTERDRWVSDPRPDLGADSAPWSLLLDIAFDADGDNPRGAFGVLHGLRCVGVGLERDERGRWRLVAGETDDYDEIRETWLMPRRREIGELLRRLELAS